MSATFLHFPPIRHGALFASLFAVTLTGGCATSSVAPPPVESGPEVGVPAVPRDWIPVARYGRYTLMELAPHAAQQNLLLQVVNVSLPANMHATVGDALHHLLRRSGYSLCDGDTAAAALYDLPLPAAHQLLGPLALHDALLTLAGPGWDLQVDDVARYICFVRVDGPDPLPPGDRPSIKTSRAVPEANGDQP